MKDLFSEKDSRYAELFDAFDKNEQQALAIAERLLKAHPVDPKLLSLAAWAAWQENKPKDSLRYAKRFGKRYVLEPSDKLVKALASAQEGRHFEAVKLLKNSGQEKYPDLPYWMITCGKMQRQVRKSFNEVWQPKLKANPRHNKSNIKSKTTKIGIIQKKTNHKTVSANAVGYAGLPKPQVFFPLRIEFKDLDKPFYEMHNSDNRTWFNLRHQLACLRLFQGFDELLCLNEIRNIETYSYQVETVRKVLKQFHGRVLLADEVGLGKTIEAGMIVKEYLLRNMIRRILILTPASLVGQWQEEMETKFNVTFNTSYDAVIRKDPQHFWQQDRIIASIASARRKEHAVLLAEEAFDLVVVDEAHHLKNRSTQNWKLVNQLKKRFLLLLSATPVQNSLVELYNLLTLLKPGIFRTESEFRKAYMTKGKPRIPANRDSMRQLMRDVMIRNTRSLVDIRLPGRQAITRRLDMEAEEACCYQTLAELVKSAYANEKSTLRLALRNLLSAAGSCPKAAALAIEQTFKKTNLRGWSNLPQKYRSLRLGAKERALIELVTTKPTEKKMVFVKHLETLHYLTELFKKQGIDFARFDGSMSGRKKDESIEHFRHNVPVLLSTESGGEGRNVQFCNILINYDLPWNPMAIEQRIGRIHRIGQEREVLIFNLVLKNTIEDEILAILDEKINMFELVVGEVGAIIGELDDKRDFSELIFDTFVHATDAKKSFENLGTQLVEAKHQYQEAQQLDNELFGEDFETL